MSDPVETYKFKDGSVLEIHQDSDPKNPREGDNLGTMAFFHKRYNIGDPDHGMCHTQFNGWDEMKEYIVKELRTAIIFPVRMYEHSGIGFAMGSDAMKYPYNCKWDSCMVGFIFVTRKRLVEEYGNLTREEGIKRAVTYLPGELEVYNQYHAGDIYGFVLRKSPCPTCGGTGEIDDSCWGFYGSNPLENGMMGQLDEDKRIELRTLIKN